MEQPTASGGLVRVRERATAIAKRIVSDEEGPRPGVDGEAEGFVPRRVDARPQ
jgi:hypothetical protein